MGRISQLVLDGKEYFVSDDGVIYTRKMKELSRYDDKDGYKYIVIKLCGKRRKIFVHRLVAFCFVKNPKTLKQVNHIDGNKANNNFSNLEWIDNSGNQIHSRYVLGNNTGFADTPVECIETGKRYKSTRDAWRDTKAGYSHISECVNGKRKTAGGYHWRAI